MRGPHVYAHLLRACCGLFVAATMTPATAATEGAAAQLAQGTAQIIIAPAANWVTGHWVEQPGGWTWVEAIGNDPPAFRVRRDRLHGATPRERSRSLV